MADSPRKRGLRQAAGFLRFARTEGRQGREISAFRQALKSFEELIKKQADTRKEERANRERERELKEVQREIAEIKREFTSKRAQRQREQEAQRRRSKTFRERIGLSSPRRGPSLRERGEGFLLSRFGVTPTKAGILKAIGLAEDAIRFLNDLQRNEDFIEEQVLESAEKIFQSIPVLGAIRDLVRTEIEQSNAQLINRILSKNFINNIAQRLNEDEAFIRFAAATASREFNETEAGRRIRRRSQGDGGTPSS